MEPPFWCPFEGHKYGHRTQHSSLEQLIKLEIQASFIAKRRALSNRRSFVDSYFRKVVGKVHAAIPKGIVGGF